MDRHFLRALFTYWRFSLSNQIASLASTNRPIASKLNSVSCTPMFNLQHA
jgi:hypothetical protein